MHLKQSKAFLALTNIFRSEVNILTMATAVAVYLTALKTRIIPFALNVASP